MKTEEMKPWQKGYELSYLLELSKIYDPYNERIQSVFSKFKKNNIAEALSNNELELLGSPVDSIIHKSQVKVPSNIGMFNVGAIFGRKEKGDLVVHSFSGNESRLKNKLSEIKGPCWVYLLEEDEVQKKLAVETGFYKVGTKYTTNGDIFGVYFKDGKTTLLKGPRKHPELHHYDLYSLPQLKFDSLIIKKGIKNVISKVDTISKYFENHYSNYNKKNSWSAISLRGYTADPQFITKPSEMNVKWQEEHKNEKFELQWTPLSKEFPEAIELVKKVCLQGKLHRLRLMKLKPGGGEIERHTDQVDRDAGTETGKVMRIHFPIITNPDVAFCVWDINGVKKQVNMKPGEAWYLDLRKPHTVINNGSNDRIHLVADIECTNNPKNDMRSFLPKEIE